MHNTSSKYKLLFIIFDILSIYLSYQTVKLLMNNNYSFFDSKYFVFLLIVITLFSNIFTEEYRYIDIRGYLQEFKYSIIYSTQIVVVFSFLLIIQKENYLKDLESLRLVLLVVLFIVSVFYVYLLRIVAKFFKKQIKEEKSSALIVTNFKNYGHLENIIKDKYVIKGYINFDGIKEYHNNKIVLNSVEDIRTFIANNRIDEIFVSSNAYDNFKETLKYLKTLGITTSININEFSRQFSGDSAIKVINDTMFLTSAIKIITLKQIFLKRTLDIIGGLVGIVLMAIVAIIIYPKVQKESKGPLIFKQKRVGKNGKVFDIYKFRSMYMDAEERKKDLMSQNNLNTTLMFKMKDDPRIFPFGQKLRDWSLDELPQFINVLKGDMSLVGTRPPTLEEYKNYELHHFKRLAVKPGITGLWQVSGRSDIEDFEEVISLDLKYIQNWSIGMDIKILLKTVQVVLKKEGSR